MLNSLDPRLEINLTLMLLELTYLELQQKSIGLLLLFLEHIDICQQVFFAFLKHLNLQRQITFEMTHHLYYLFIALVDLAGKNGLHRIILLFNHCTLIFKRTFLALVKFYVRTLKVIVIRNLHILLKVIHSLRPNYIFHHFF